MELSINLCLLIELIEQNLEKGNFNYSLYI